MRHHLLALTMIGMFGFHSTANAQRQAGLNQNGNRNMPSVQQLAQMMIGNFDADASGELNQAELQNALNALRQMMQNRRNGQDQAGLQQNGLGNQQNGLQVPQGLQANQRPENQPPPFRGRGGFRRGR